MLPVTARGVVRRCGCLLGSLLVGGRSSRRPRSRAAGAGVVTEQHRHGLATQAHATDQEEEDQGIGAMLKRVVASRHSAKSFDASRGEVPEHVLADVLAMTLVRS